MYIYFIYVYIYIGRPGIITMCVCLPDREIRVHVQTRRGVDSNTSIPDWHYWKRAIYSTGLIFFAPFLSSSNYRHFLSKLLIGFSHLFFFFFFFFCCCSFFFSFIMFISVAQSRQN